jgi:hypothetical protein
VIRILILLAGLSVASTAGAQEELRLGGGSSHETNLESTYGWELDYAHGLSDHVYLSLGWLNEGHQLDEHRDGFTAEAWAHADFFDQRLSLAVGAGPYLFFDTSRDEAHPFFAPYENGHGLRPLYSAELTWYVDPSWLAYIRANHIEDGDHVRTTMLLLGFGYSFDGHPIYSASSSPADTTSGPRDNELTLYIGQTTLNSFVSESSTAYALDYRRHLSLHSDWTLGWLNEGANELIRRNGITTEFWLEDPVLDGRVELGAGAGAYIVVNQQNQTFVVMHHKATAVPSDDERVEGMISFTAAWRFDPSWSARFSFNRIVTSYDRDADVILIGAGYRF